MVTIILRRQRGQSEQLVRNGLAPDGRQRYLCRDCGQSAPLLQASETFFNEAMARALDRVDAA